MKDLNEGFANFTDKVVAEMITKQNLTHEKKISQVTKLSKEMVSELEKKVFEDENIFRVYREGQLLEMANLISTEKFTERTDKMISDLKKEVEDNYVSNSFFTVYKSEQLTSIENRFTEYNNNFNIVVSNKSSDLEKLLKEKVSELEKDFSMNSVKIDAIKEKINNKIKDEIENVQKSIGDHRKEIDNIIDDLRLNDQRTEANRNSIDNVKDDVQSNDQLIKENRKSIDEQKHINALQKEFLDKQNDLKLAGLSSQFSPGEVKKRELIQSIQSGNTDAEADVKLLDELFDMTDEDGQRKIITSVQDNIEKKKQISFRIPGLSF